MRRVRFAGMMAMAIFCTGAFGRGVSPYLPLNLEPEMERQIERVLILAGRPVMTRPIPAALVLDALPDACAKDAALCAEVRRYLSRYMRSMGVTHLSAEGLTSSGTDHVVANSYGRSTDSSWAASASGFWQPSDYVSFSAGAVAYQGESSPTGSLVSLGFDRAQLDIGYRAHWLSPMTDSSMLISTEATTMPSVTLSNYLPLTRLGLHYELFVAEMSSSNDIEFEDGLTSGHPRLMGLHLSAEPVSGWSLGVNRLLQFGGGARQVGVRDVFNAFFLPTRFDNTGTTSDPNAEFGNQVAAITSSMIFPGRTPFSVYFEYAGEDTSAGKNLLLGNSSLSAGIHFPRLWQRFDLTYETTDFQNGWYVHHIYHDGLTNDGRVIGSWFGDQRVPGNAVGGQSHMVRLGWYPTFGGSFDLRARTLKNENYSALSYERAHDVTFSYSRPWGPVRVGGEMLSGRDFVGKNFTQVGMFVRMEAGLEAAASAATGGSSGGEPPGTGTEVFVSAGATSTRMRVDVDNNIPIRSSNAGTGAYFGLGARRPVSERSDLGVRAEVADVDGRTLLAVRAVDYRYRTRGPLALNGFLGAARYDLATSAQGVYGGFGVEWRDIMKGWNLGLDASCAWKVARDHLLPDENTNGGQPDTFYDIYRATISLTRHF